MSSFQERIHYRGDDQLLFSSLCQTYDLGVMLRAQPVEVGYEDFNVMIETDRGKYFAKFFASFRSQADCQQYVSTMQTVIDAGIHHPQLLGQPDEYLHTLEVNGALVPVCVMEYIEGKTFYDLKQQPKIHELLFLVQEAAKINSLPIKTKPVYDSWACVNFLNEYALKKQHLSHEHLSLIEPLVDEFANIRLEQLPHAFIHGDIIKTNVMRSTDGQIFILDFSVSNHYPRIQELAVLFCDLFFHDADPSHFPNLYEEGLASYQQQLPLTTEELDILPLYTKVAHAMHILCANYEKVVNGNVTEENNSWIALGEKGLMYTNQLWK